MHRHPKRKDGGTFIKRNMDKDRKEAEQEENLFNSMIYDESIDQLYDVGKPSRGLMGSRRGPQRDSRQHEEVPVGRRPNIFRRDHSY